MPVGPSTTRPASSSSSNQTAIAASAALCQVCRLENPSSNSPIRFAASSATAVTPSSTDGSSMPGLPQEPRGREIVGDPDGLEIGGEEEPAGAEHVVAVGVIDVALGVRRRGAPPRPRPRRLAHRECPAPRVRRPLAEPEMLQPGPGASWRSPVYSFPARRTAMRRGDARGRTRSGEPSRGQIPPSAVSSALTRGRLGRPS